MFKIQRAPSANWWPQSVGNAHYTGRQGCPFRDYLKKWSNRPRWISWGSTKTKISPESRVRKLQGKGRLAGDHLCRKESPSQQGVLAAVKVNHMLDCISNTVSSTSREIIVPFHFRGVTLRLIRDWIQGWGPHAGKWEHVKQRVTKMDNTV